MKSTQNEIRWSNRSPEERDQIALNRSRASYKNPFSGKNASQRNRLHSAFWAMGRAV